MVEKVYKAGKKAWWILYVLGMLIPILSVLMSGQSLSKTVNSTAMNGLITASGIFLGFLTVSLVNRGELVDFDLKYAIYLDMILFGFAIMFLYLDILNFDTPIVRDLVLIMTSLIAEIFTAFAVVRSVLKEEVNVWAKKVMSKYEVP